MPLFRETEPGFEGLFGILAEQHEIDAFAIEKDYWITQVLRTASQMRPGHLIFKGGTSLSKGYRLIERFSEDVDLLLVQGSPPPTDPEREREIKAFCSGCAESIGAEAKRISGNRQGLHRKVEVSAPVHNSGVMRREIILDTGFVGGGTPIEPMQITTMLGEFMPDVNADEFEDLSPFDVDVLMPHRTLIEKLLILNLAADEFAENPEGFDDLRSVRHFYDVHFLLQNDKVREDLENRVEFEAVVKSAISISSEHYDQETRRPDDGFAASAAFDADGEFVKLAEPEYDAVLRGLHFGTGPIPSLGEVRETVAAYAALL